jgi:hypothetical protein
VRLVPALGVSVTFRGTGPGRPHPGNDRLANGADSAGPLLADVPVLFAALGPARLDHRDLSC